MNENSESIMKNSSIVKVFAALQEREKDASERERKNE